MLKAEPDWAKEKMLLDTKEGLGCIASNVFSWVWLFQIKEQSLQLLTEEVDYKVNKYIHFNSNTGVILQRFLLEIIASNVYG